MKATAKKAALWQSKAAHYAGKKNLPFLQKHWNCLFVLDKLIFQAEKIMFCALDLNLHEVMSTYCTAESGAHSLALYSFLNEALHMAFTSLNTTSLLYEQTGVQQADRQQASPLVAPRLQTDKNTHTHTHTQRERERGRDNCLNPNSYFINLPPWPFLKTQIKCPHCSTEKKTLGPNDCAHHMRADTQANVLLAGLQHPVLWRNRKCVYLYKQLSEGGRITVRRFSF